MTGNSLFTMQKYNFFCIYQNFFVPLRKIMTKRRFYHIIEWTIALAACGFLVWKLATYDDYAGLWATLCGMGPWQWSALALCVALMPVNMALEAWRWKTLIPMSWREAHRQVYYSKLAGLITPWKLGEYPARAVLMEGQSDDVQCTRDNVWSRVLSMGAVGSATMTMAIVIAGVAAMIMDNGQWTMDNGDWSLEIGYFLLVGTELVLLVVALALAPRLLRRWAEVSHKLVLVSIGQSLVRLACWCVQLALVLYALGAISNFLSQGNDCFKFLIPRERLLQISNLPIYYLLVTITPNVPIAEAGVRGAWAVVLFGSVNAALAGVLLWGINTLLPCLVWPFLSKKDKKFA